MSTLPPYVTREIVADRLALVFPDGSSVQHVGTPVAASTVFAMLYVGAVQGTKRYAGPKHIYKMSTKQSKLTSDDQRLHYAVENQKSKFVGIGPQWYADNTREPIRDETLRQGLISVGAVIDRTDLAKNAKTPRYALQKEFAELFDPGLVGEALNSAIERWQKKNLSKNALARMRILRASGAHEGNISVQYPNGEVRKLSPGTSSVIAKAVVEEFAPRFPVNPHVLILSDPSTKTVLRDDVLARSIGFNIDTAAVLPDIILVDLGTDESELLFVFVEVVHSDGPVSGDRRKDLMAIAVNAGFEEKQVAFVTAYLERSATAFRKTFAAVAWNSFAWLASEPDQIVEMLDIKVAAKRRLRIVLDAD